MQLLRGSLVKAYALLTIVVWRQGSIPLAYLYDNQYPSYTYEGVKLIAEYSRQLPYL